MSSSIRIAVGKRFFATAREMIRFFMTEVSVLFKDCTRRWRIFHSISMSPGTQSYFLLHHTVPFFCTLFENFCAIWGTLGDTLAPPNPLPLYPTCRRLAQFQSSSNSSSLSSSPKKCSATLATMIRIYHRWRFFARFK